jgi:DNA-binding transcriptional LysR family regulator
MISLELNDLIIFKTVVTEGSISKAAKELGYVQPNVTERIKRLEEELETPLLHRTNKGVTLLPSGEILLGYTNKILNLLEEARNEIQLENKPYRIGTTQAILLNYLHTRINENVTDFQLYMENSSRLLPLLQSQKVDMIITYLNHQDPELHNVFSSTISMGLLKTKGKTTIDFSKEVFFVNHDTVCPYRNRTIEFLEEQKLSKNQLQQVDSYSLIKELVTHGRGIAFLPIDNKPLEVIKTVAVKPLPVYFFTSSSNRKSVPRIIFE